MPLKNEQRQIVIAVLLIAIHDLFVVNKNQSFVFLWMHCEHYAQNQ